MQMTEIEAWKFLAGKWSNAKRFYLFVGIVIHDDYDYDNSYDGEMVCEGICESAAALLNEGMISVETYRNMKNKLNCYQLEYNICGYWWPRNLEGAAERAKFCKEMVELLENLI